MVEREREREREREGFSNLMFCGNVYLYLINVEWNYIVFTLQACHNFYEQRERDAPKEKKGRGRP